MPSETLSYEEIRQQNIARNQDFLNILFPDGAIFSQTEQTVTAQEIVDTMPTEEDEETLSQRLNEKIPVRSEESLILFKYLNRVRC
jgi:hypothetical protein